MTLHYHLAHAGVPSILHFTKPKCISIKPMQNIDCHYAVLCLWLTYNTKSRSLCPHLRSMNLCQFKDTSTSTLFTLSQCCPAHLRSSLDTRSRLVVSLAYPCHELLQDLGSPHKVVHLEVDLCRDTRPQLSLEQIRRDKRVVVLGQLALHPL